MDYRHMQSLFQTSSSPPSPPVELCNDIFFEIFLRLPPEVLPRISILNKQFNAMINSPLFQTMYWTGTLRLPRLCAMVYYERKLNSGIGLGLLNKERNQYKQVPQIRFQSSYYSRLLQWTESMLQYYEMVPN